MVMTTSGGLVPRHPISTGFSIRCFHPKIESLKDEVGQEYANSQQALFAPIVWGVFMRLSIKSLAFTCALLWGGALLTVGLINLAVPTYGLDFLRGMSSVYPGYHPSRSLLEVLIGAGYGVIDGAIGGLVFGWLYNLFVRLQIFELPVESRTLPSEQTTVPMPR
jgi:hypothetical protein